MVRFKHRTELETGKAESEKTTRELLVHTAIDLFMEKSYNDVSMSMIAQRAKKTKALIFHYFSNKLDLATECMRLSFIEMQKEIQAIQKPEESPRQRLRTFLDFYIGDYHWPAFNIADSAISIGIFIFALHVLFKKIPE